MMTDPAPVDRFTWERALRSDPTVAGTRLMVLLTLGTYMDADGTNARPPQATLAEDTGLKERAVRGHLSWAVANGWLELIQRGHHIVNTGRSVASLYRATSPQPAPERRLYDHHTTGTTTPVVNDTSGSPMPVVEADDAPQPAREGPTTGTPVPPTTDHELPTSPRAVTYEEPGDVEEGKGDITPRRIFSEMARRRLMVGRQTRAAWAPEERCDPRREQGFLRTEFDALQAQHGFELDTLLARFHPHAPAKPRHADPDWYVWRLDRTLARRDWGHPTAEETRAKLERERAERKAAYDPELADAGRQEALALRDRLLAEQQRRRLGVPA